MSLDNGGSGGWMLAEKDRKIICGYKGFKTSCLGKSISKCVSIWLDIVLSVLLQLSQVCQTKQELSVMVQADNAGPNMFVWTPRSCAMGSTESMSWVPVATPGSWQPYPLVASASINPVASWGHQPSLCRQLHHTTASATPSSPNFSASYGVENRDVGIWVLAYSNSKSWSSSLILGIRFIAREDLIRSITRLWNPTLYLGSKAGNSILLKFHLKSSCSPATRLYEA